MNLRLKRARELAGYAVQLTKDEGLPTMLKRGAGFVKRRCFGKKARYLPAKKVLEAQRAEMAGKTAADCGLPTISVLTPLYNTPEKYLREFLDSFVNQTAPNGQLCLADASDAQHGDVQRIVEEYQAKNQRIVYKKIETRALRPTPTPLRSWPRGSIWRWLTTTTFWHPMPCTPWARLSCSCGSVASRTAFCTATKPCSARASGGPARPTSSRTMRRITCCAATTSAIWRCSKGTVGCCGRRTPGVRRQPGS